MKKNRKNPLIIALIVIGIIVVIPALFAALGYGIQFLWNNTISAIFHTETISFWQAIMILILSKVLFSNEYNVKVLKNRYSKHKKINDNIIEEEEFLDD